MNWHIQWDERVEFLESIARQGNFIPPALLSKPVLSQFEQPFYHAFMMLNGSRQYTSVGPTTIHISEIIKYLKDHLEITDIDERDEYVDVIRQLDTFYVDLCLRKEE